MQAGDHHTTRDGDQTLSSMTQLLALGDEAFVEAAYRVILGRPADPEGRQFYTSRLRRGDAPLRLLAMLRGSREGQLVQASLPGMGRMLAISRLAHLPIVGRVVSALTGIEGNTRADRNRRRLENALARTEAQLAAAPGWGRDRPGSGPGLQPGESAPPVNAYIARIAIELGA